MKPFSKTFKTFPAGSVLLEKFARHRKFPYRQAKYTVHHIQCFVHAARGRFERKGFSSIINGYYKPRGSALLSIQLHISRYKLFHALSPYRFTPKSSYYSHFVFHLSPCFGRENYYRITTRLLRVTRLLSFDCKRYLNVVLEKIFLSVLSIDNSFPDK